MVVTAVVLGGEHPMMGLVYWKYILAPQAGVESEELEGGVTYTSTPQKEQQPH